MSDESQTEPVVDPSPLQEADPHALERLWNRIDAKLVAGLPREIMDSDIDAVVDYYRKLRVRFMNEQVQNIKPGRRKGDGTGRPTSVAAALARQAEAVKDIEL